MLLGSGCTRDLRVGDVADEEMAKQVLALVPDRGAALATHELLALEAVEHVFGLGSVQLADPLHGAEPEDLADNRGVLKKQLLLEGDRVEARRDDALHGLREPDLGLVTVAELTILANSSA